MLTFATSTVAGQLARFQAATLARIATGTA
jgi:hypothetical protein